MDRLVRRRRCARRRNWDVCHGVVLHEFLMVTPVTLALNVYITHTGCTLATVSGFRFVNFCSRTRKGWMEHDYSELRTPRRQHAGCPGQAPPERGLCGA